MDNQDAHADWRWKLPNPSSNLQRNSEWQYECSSGWTLTEYSRSSISWLQSFGSFRLAPFDRAKRTRPEEFGSNENSWTVPMHSAGTARKPRARADCARACPRALRAFPLRQRAPSFRARWTL